MLTIAIWVASVALGFEVGLGLLTLTGFAAAVVGLWRPALGILGIVLLCTLDAVSRFYVHLLTGGLLRFNTLNYWLLVVILLNLRWLMRLHDLQIRLLQLFIVLLTIELAFSSDLPGGAQHVINVASIFGLISYLARAPADRDIWYWSALLSGVVSAMGCFVFYLQQERLPQLNENAWSFFPLTSLFAICVYLAQPAPQRRSRAIVALAIVNAGWVFLSGSRGSFFICMICILFILARLKSAKDARLVIAAAVLVAGGIVSQFGGLESRSIGRLAKLFDQAQSMTSRTSGRWDIALGGWYIFLDHPLGVGTGAFADTWATLVYQRRFSTYHAGSAVQAHSGWIKVLAENGIPGIVLFVAVVGSFAVLGWRRRGAGMFLPGLLVTLVLSVAFLADEFQGKGLWYLAAAIMVLTRREVARGSGAARMRGAGRRHALLSSQSR